MISPRQRFRSPAQDSERLLQENDLTLADVVEKKLTEMADARSCGQNSLLKLDLVEKAPGDSRIVNATMSHSDKVTVLSAFFK